MGEQIALERVLRRIKARAQELAGFCEGNERFSPHDRGFRRRRLLPFRNARARPNFLRRFFVTIG
jgi:hypothetical protein